MKDILIIAHFIMTASEKGNGRFTEFPHTRTIAIASPRARPIPRTTPVIIPDFAAGTVTLKIVWILLAPSAKEEFLYCCGTARNELSLILITVGKIIIANTITADNKLAPPVNRWSGSFLKINCSNLYIPGFIIKIPNKPYTTEGMPANSSTAGFTICANFLFEISDKNIAVINAIGTPIKIANVVAIIEVKIIYNIPNLGSVAVGAHSVPNKISKIPTLNNAGAPE